MVKVGTWCAILSSQTETKSSLKTKSEKSQKRKREEARRGTEEPTRNTNLNPETQKEAQSEKKPNQAPKGSSQSVCLDAYRAHPLYRVGFIKHLNKGDYHD